MDPLATGRAYRVLAELLSRPPAGPWREAAQASPILAAALETYPSDDEVAADHQHAFGFAVHPYEGAFLDPAGAVGATAAERLAETYRRIGFRVDPTGDDPEHLATELRALAFLCGAEADAVEDGLLAVAARVRDLAAEVLDQHLSRWLAPFAAAVRRCGLAYPTALVEQVASLVALHRASLGAPPPPPFELPPRPDPLDDEAAGLADIARTLTTPALSGTYLSRDDVGRIARAGRVPRGFGERAVILDNALRSAAHLDALPATLEALAATLEEERGGAAEPWRSRLEETIATVARLRRAAAAQTGAERRAGA